MTGGLELDDFLAHLDAALGAGDVAALQLRLKDVPDHTIRAAVRAVMPRVQDAGAAFILNDRPDLAAELGCDGVHVGQDDAPYEEARRLVGPDAIVGVTCKDSRHLAMEAGEAGADYVAFGAFFPSSTKAVTRRADPALLAWWHEVATIPSVAIGGITADNCGPLVQAGTDFLCIATGVWDHAGGAAAGVRAVNEAIGRALEQRESDG